MPVPLPNGAAVIKAKQLFDQLDTSQMTPEELEQHAALKRQLESQPAIQVAARSTSPPAARFGDPHGYNPTTLEQAAPYAAHPLDALGSFASTLNPLPALAHPINTFKSDWNARGAAYERLKARGSKLITDDPASPESGEDLRNLYETLIPGLGPMLAGAGRQMNSPNPHERAKGFGAAVAATSGPKIVSNVAGAAGRVASPAYTRLTARLPERMIGSIAGSESRAGARAVMARRIPTSGDPGNLPVENFAKNVSAATNQAGADVSRVIDTHTAASKGAAVDVADALQKPYEKRIAEVAKFARGEQAADAQVAALTDQAEARQRAAADYAGLKNWQPGEPIPMTPAQIHKLTRDWRASVKGGFDRMEPTEQAAIMNLHDAIKSAVPDADEAMQDYHDLLRYNENLQTYANPEGGAVQAGSLVPELTSTLRGATRRKIAGGAGWKVPVAYWLNEHAPAGYRYTGTFNPAKAPAASAGTLAGGAAAPASASPAPAPAVPSGGAAPASAPIRPQIVPRAPAALEAMPPQPGLPAAAQRPKLPAATPHAVRAAAAADGARYRQTAADVESARRYNAQGAVPLGGAIEPPPGPRAMPGRILPSYNAERTAAFRPKQSAGTPTPDFGPQRAPGAVPAPQASAKPPVASSAPEALPAPSPAPTGPQRFDPQAIIERNRQKNLAATAESEKAAGQREAQMPVRHSAVAQQTLRPRKPGEPLSVPAEAPKAAKAAAPAAATKAPLNERLAAKKLLAQAPTAPASSSAPAAAGPTEPATARSTSFASGERRLPSQMSTEGLKDLLPKLRQQASAAKGADAKKLNMKADIVAGELKRRLSAAGQPTANPLEGLSSKSTPAPSRAPKQQSIKSIEPGDEVDTKAGKGTVTHTVKKADGSTVHFVDGVGTKSGRTVVHEA